MKNTEFHDLLFKIFDNDDKVEGAFFILNKLSNVAKEEIFQNLKLQIENIDNAK